MSVRWLTLFIDRPAASFDRAADFWQAVTGTERSASRGEHGQFATLLPVGGDAHVRVQRVDDGPGGTHLDIHTDDTTALTERALELGATLVRTDPVQTLRSPGGFLFCIVDWHGEATPSAPHIGPSGSSSRLDQICLDITPRRFDEEVTFWPAFLEWTKSPSPTHPEFVAIPRRPDMPMRLLLQRLDEGDGDTTGHLDLAAGAAVGDVVADHVVAGATVVHEARLWTVLRDPSGHRYCITRRDPLSGSLG